MATKSQSLRKRFPGFNLALIEKAFRLTKVSNHEALREWIAQTKTPSSEEKAALEKLRTKLAEYIDYWNEYELKVHFITRIVELVDYQHPPEYAYFLERTLSATVDDIEIVCVPDLLIASGKTMPEAPYFCLHEYKRQRTETEPLGQLLIQMLSAQDLNGGSMEQPVYGCYVSGQFWNFVVLVGKTYSVSPAFVATKDDIYDIFAILKSLKSRIEAIIQANKAKKN